MPKEARALIASALHTGWPLFNHGKTEECLEIFQTCLENVFKTEGLPVEHVQMLRHAIQVAEEQSTLKGSCMMLRKAFETLLEGPAPGARTVSADGTEIHLIDFQESIPPLPDWFSLDDFVMGGVSSSSWQHSAADGGGAIFSGTLSTAYNGGFASVRSSPWGGWAVARARGLRVRVRGDGRKYKITCKTDDEVDGVVYQQDFSTEENQWQTVDLPYANFKPNFRGRLAAKHPALAGDKIRQLGIMVSKFSDSGATAPGFKQGQFTLAIKWIKAFV